MKAINSLNVYVNLLDCFIGLSDESLFVVELYSETPAVFLDLLGGELNVPDLVIISLG